jgi:hypothetical protein
VKSQDAAPPHQGKNGNFHWLLTVLEAKTNGSVKLGTKNKVSVI